MISKSRGGPPRAMMSSLLQPSRRQEGKKCRSPLLFIIFFGTCVFLSVDRLSKFRREYLVFIIEDTTKTHRATTSYTYNDVLKTHNGGEVQEKKRNDKSEHQQKKSGKVIREPAFPTENVIQLGDKEQHCSPWNISLDEWWQEHPDWEIAQENDTHTCFHPIEHSIKADFYRELHQIQSSTDCSTLRTRYVLGTGFAASISYLLDGFWSAYREQRPFERSKHREGFRWIYAPPFAAAADDDDDSKRNQTNWAACPSQDMTCYFLPLTTHCQNSNWTIGHEDQPLKKYYKSELEKDVDAQEKFLWLEQYFMRPKQVTRYHLHQLKQQAKVPAAEDISTPCTVLHVRRADATSEPQHPRNFHPLSKYLSMGNVSAAADNKETIILLTDDESAIDEANLLHPEYQWLYVNRTRHRGKMPKHSHIPSSNESLELLYILAELKMVRGCHKLVHGKSNFVKMITRSMQLEHGIDGVETISIDGDVTIRKEDRIPAELFMKELEAKLRSNSQAYILKSFQTKASTVVNKSFKRFKT